MSADHSDDQRSSIHRREGTIGIHRQVPFSEVRGCTSDSCPWGTSGGTHVPYHVSPQSLDLCPPCPLTVLTHLYASSYRALHLAPLPICKLPLLSVAPGSATLSTDSCVQHVAYNKKGRESYECQSLGPRLLLPCCIRNTI